MARTKQYVVYTREFSKGRVNSKIGVFVDEAKKFVDANGNVNGLKIKHATKKMTRSTPTKALLDRGYSVFCRVVATNTLDKALQTKDELINLLASSGRTIINNRQAA